MKMNHGFAEAADFEAAALSYVDRTSQAPNGGKPIAVGWSLVEEKVIAGEDFQQPSILYWYWLEPQP
ncbi:hypothetical protein ACNQQN_24820 [Mycobacteroides chelonae]|uniref:hypothetical protein n=1 Tax=Mycobacteroides chelonae TaxID=1774 RepID=UPI003AAD2FB6